MGRRNGGAKNCPHRGRRVLKRTSQGCASHGPHSDGASEARAGHRRTDVVGVGLGVFPEVGTGCRGWG